MDTGRIGTGRQVRWTEVRWTENEVGVIQVEFIGISLRYEGLVNSTMGSYIVLPFTCLEAFQVNGFKG